MGTQMVMVTWDNHHPVLTAGLQQVLANEMFTDVTLICEDNTLKAHKVFLVALSGFFQELFSGDFKNCHIVNMKNIKFKFLKETLTLMYEGQIRIFDDQLPELFEVAELLQVKGFIENSSYDVSYNKKLVSEEKMDVEFIVKMLEEETSFLSGYYDMKQKHKTSSNQMAEEEPTIDPSTLLQQEIIEGVSFKDMSPLSDCFHTGNSKKKRNKLSKNFTRIQKRSSLLGNNSEAKRNPKPQHKSSRCDAVTSILSMPEISNVTCTETEHGKNAKEDSLLSYKCDSPEATFSKAQSKSSKGKDNGNLLSEPLNEQQAFTITNQSENSVDLSAKTKRGSWKKKRREEYLKGHKVYRTRSRQKEEHSVTPLEDKTTSGQGIKQLDRKTKPTKIKKIKEENKDILNSDTINKDIHHLNFSEWFAKVKKNVQKKEGSLKSQAETSLLFFSDDFTDTVLSSDDHSNTSRRRCPYHEPRHENGNKTNVYNLFQQDYDCSTKYDCNICHSHFTNKLEYLMHLKQHPTAFPLSCICPTYLTKFSGNRRKTAKIRSVRSKYQLTTSLTNPFSCNKCGKVFHSKAGFQHHQISHNRYACSKCGEEYSKIIHFRRHQRECRVT